MKKKLYSDKVLSEGIAWLDNLESVDVTTGGISLNSHTHGGVTTGAGSTGGPQ